MPLTKQLIGLVPLTLILLGLLSYNFMSAQWSAPTATAPGNNATAPINISNNYQAKLGDLGAVRMRAGEYCDAAGLNCRSATSTGGDTVTVGGQCFEPAYLVTCNWNWSGDGNDNGTYIGNIGLAPTQACPDSRSYQYHEVILAKCGVGRYVWRTGAWPLGAGGHEKQRTVQCIDRVNSNQIVADSNCSSPKPATSRR